jgi:mannose-6-phosphate isomerase-like protein (cupin superfamily)
MKRRLVIAAWGLTLTLAFLAGYALAPAGSASAQAGAAQPAAAGRGQAPPPAGALPPGEHSKIQLSPDQGEPTHFRGADLRDAHTQLQARAKQSGQGAVVPRDLMKSMVTRTHSYIMVHRTGQATVNPEQHEGVTDVYFITGGSGTVTVGGEIPNRRVVRPGEYSGDPIKGGQAFKLQAGDILNIPPNAPHATMADASGMTYVLMKVNVGLYPWSLVNGTP